MTEAGHSSQHSLPPIIAITFTWSGGPGVAGGSVAGPVGESAVGIPSATSNRPRVVSVAASRAPQILL
jgi:hypothetical protein